jgi:hypothetical protein
MDKTRPHLSLIFKGLEGDGKRKAWSLLTGEKRYQAHQQN